MHLIPRDESLWNLERYDEFIEARKALIVQKFTYMLRKDVET